MLQKLKSNLIWLVLAGLAGAAFFGFSFLASSESKVKIDFFDVGQGSSIFVSAPNGNQVLIDGGPSDAVLAKLGENMPLNDRKIELLILTHPDSDHLSGLIEVLKRYQIGQILETGILDNTAEYQSWNQLIKEKNVSLIYASQGQVIKMADNLAVQILYPFDKINGQDFLANSNNSSIIGKLYYGKNSMLFTGDAERTAEWALAMGKINLKADILAVGHHGSKTSTSPEFLAAVLPKIAVIQVGAKNRYGHPSQETLERLKRIQILRTDQNGDIKFVCDLEACQFAN